MNPDATASRLRQECLSRQDFASQTRVSEPPRFGVSDRSIRRHRGTTLRVTNAHSRRPATSLATIATLPPPDDPRSDLDLVAALNAGDASAFDALYYRYRDRVTRLALRFTNHDADALDVTQETFTYLYRKFPGFRLTASMTTFLFPVVRNLSLAARRKRNRATTPAGD